ncbi:ester cyclase [Frigidibacter oleivorans]|uniref:ester cyclase n=1 Tax=Frigidibacter oleivorans TaxID=2487129 RepID=UPI000F8DE411|nr:ester cyclase [Frigidibacter oleivorans]
MTTADENIEILRAAFTALNRRDIDACTSLMTDDFIINIAEMPHQKHGRAAWRKHAEIMLDAFPDTRVEIEDIIASQDKLAVRVKISGTHQGEFLGTRPTAKRVSYTSHEVYRFENGKLAEEWICSDMMTLFMQIGALSKGRVISMWLSGYRFWGGAAVGGLIAAFATAALASL